MTFFFWRWLGAYSHSGFHLCVKFRGPPKLLKMSKITLTRIFPAWGVLRQEDCCDLKASLSYTVRLFLSTNQKEEEEQNNHHFKLVFHVGLQFVLWNGFSFSTPNIPGTFFAHVKPSQRTGWGPPASHLLMVHLTTLCLSSGDANVKGTHKAIFLEMQRRWEKRNVTKRDNWLAILQEFDYNLIFD